MITVVLLLFTPPIIIFALIEYVKTHYCKECKRLKKMRFIGSEQMDDLNVVIHNKKDYKFHDLYKCLNCGQIKKIKRSTATAEE